LVGYRRSSTRDATSVTNLTPDASERILGPVTENIATSAQPPRAVSSCEFEAIRLWPLMTVAQIRPPYRLSDSAFGFRMQVSPS